MKKILITQSNYIPWKGYFDAINSVNDFVIYDDAQFTKGDWRNRNRIKTSHGTQWITIPVNMKNRLSKKINEIKISDENWSKKHWNIVKINYSSAPYFKYYQSFFEELYMNCNEQYLSMINFRWSSEFDLKGDRSEKLLNICLDLKASEYYSGPAAKDYLNTSLFKTRNMKISWINYDGYREYDQLYPPFEHAVSIIDLIFNTGPEIKKYLKGFAESA